MISVPQTCKFGKVKLISKMQGVLGRWDIHIT